MAVKESALQRQIVDGLRAMGAEVFITHDSKHKPVTPGISDIIAVFAGRILFVECKADGGRLSREQAAFLERMRAKGHVAIVARSWEDVEAYL